MGRLRREDYLSYNSSGRIAVMILLQTPSSSSRNLSSCYSQQNPGATSLASPQSSWGKVEIKRRRGS